MIVASLSECIGVTPSISMILGNSGSQRVVEQFNNTFGTNHGVLFGQASDPYAEKYRSFLDLVVAPIKVAADKIRAATDFVFHKERVRLISCEEDLMNIPECMELPIITMPRIQDLLKKNKIYGFGYDATCFPTEDVVGRLIDNGKVDLNPLDGSDTPEYITWEFASDDPDYNEDELETIEESREWIDSFLSEQLKPGGKKLDPTNSLRKMSTGK